MSAPDSEELTPDDIFEILSNHRRRMVLYYLRRTGGTADVTELAGEIASMENGVPVEDLTSQQRKRVYVSLYQTHLPKMAQMNAIEYDKDAGTVRLTDRTNNIDRYLTSGEQVTYPWRFHYLALTIVGGVLLSLSAAGAPVLESASLLWLGIGTLAMFAVSATVQLFLRRQDDSVPFELSQYDR
ncbi:hypothetical protein GJ629_00860 [Halapricum sp. CBA1109]|uniref:DUF7344 domain-containing protein n=1 Tax=Halapricum sp. CBA1109 TaxID=2668068 RepID=UPI0012F70A0A|nr:hypothetical protein [Halapricum sp. CBA1109]MUV88618.1 hypothetical protein [Halapricum sp. CBA1109]